MVRVTTALLLTLTLALALTACTRPDTGTPVPRPGTPPTTQGDTAS